MQALKSFSKKDTYRAMELQIASELPRCQTLFMSITMALLGIGEIFLSVAAFIHQTWGHKLAHGTWIGFIAFLTGMFGIIAVKTKGLWAIRLNFILSLVSLCVSVVLIILSAGGIDLNSGFYPFTETTNRENWRNLTKIVNGTLLAIACLQLILSVLGSYVCFKFIHPAENVIKSRHKQGLKNLEGKIGTSHLFGPINKHSFSKQYPNSISQQKNGKKKHKSLSRNRQSGIQNEEIFVEAFACSMTKHCMPNKKHFSLKPKRRHGSRHHKALKNKDNYALTERERDFGENQVGDSLLVHPSIEMVSNIQTEHLLTHEKHPIPIEDDEELPPYRLIEPHVYTMSLNNQIDQRNEFYGEGLSSPNAVASGYNPEMQRLVNCNLCDNESLTLSNTETDSDSAVSDNGINIETWESVSRRDVPPMNEIFPGIRHSPIENITDQSRCPNFTRSSELEHTKLSPDIEYKDLQGVNYHIFKNSVKTITHPKRSRSFQDECKFAQHMEYPISTSLHNSISNISMDPNKTNNDICRPLQKQDVSLASPINTTQLSLITQQFKVLCSSLEKAQKCQPHVVQLDAKQSSNNIQQPDIDINDQAKCQTQCSVVHPKNTCLVFPMIGEKDNEKYDICLEEACEKPTAAKSTISKANSVTPVMPEKQLSLLPNDAIDPQRFSTTKSQNASFKQNQVIVNTASLGRQDTIVTIQPTFNNPMEETAKVPNIPKKDLSLKPYLNTSDKELLPDRLSTETKGYVTSRQINDSENEANSLTNSSSLDISLLTCDEGSVESDSHRTSDSQEEKEVANQIRISNGQQVQTAYSDKPIYSMLL